MALQTTIIAYATEDDISALGQVLTESHGTEAVMAFFFKDWPAQTTMLPFMTSRIGLKFADPKTKVIKITDNKTNKILGFTALTLETGEAAAERDITNLSKATAPPPTIDWAFGEEVMVGLTKLDQLMVGVKHYGTPLSSHSSHTCTS
jgi:hypothetical protein